MKKYEAELSDGSVMEVEANNEDEARSEVHGRLNFLMIRGLPVSKIVKVSEVDEQD